MTKLAAYKYDLSKSERKRSLFSPEQGQTVIASAREEFGKLLTGRSLNIYRVKPSGESEIFKTENVLHDEVAVFTIENNKQVSQWLNKQKNKLPNNPWCWVMIDNRPGEMKMLIEDNSAWVKPDDVRNLLQQNFNQKLSEVGLEIDIRPIMLEQEFWKVVEQRCHTNNDSVKKVVFEMVNPEKADGISMPNRRYAFLKSTLDVMEATNTFKTTFAMEANKRDAILLERTRRDLSQMVRLCCNNGYTITVHFRKSKQYVAGDQERTYEMVEEGLLTNFFNSQTVIDNDNGATFDLILWLNEISKNRKKHERTIGRKRKTSSDGSTCQSSATESAQVMQAV